MSAKTEQPRDHVTVPDERPWIPAPPPLEPETPIVMPDLATLERARDALKRL